METKERILPKRGGKTRDDFLMLFPQMMDWLVMMESEHGSMERMGSLGLRHDRSVTMICFARAWAISIYNMAMPREVNAHGELSFVISPEVMAALVGLHTVLKPADDIIWDALIMQLER